MLEVVTFLGSSCGSEISLGKEGESLKQGQGFEVKGGEKER